MTTRAAKPTTPTETDQETPATTPEPDVVGRTHTTPERPVWEINGKLYDVRVLDDFGLVGHRRLNSDGREFFQLWNATEDLTDDQEARMEQLLERMFLGDDKVPSIIDAPKTLLRKFGPASRAEVVLTFILAPLQKLVLAAAQMETETGMDQAGVGEPMTAS